ncbi:MAG: TlpA family protein disulfide reductase [Hyphomonadaceae bacterium]|nr:TlpA family protein disulfide reductase [Hyphomonadaceae bacterium]
MLKTFIGGLLILGFAACAEAHNHSEDGADKAVDYYRPGAVIPDTADLSRGDVPRDDYGRPYMYEGLGEVLPDFTGELASGASWSSTLLEGRWTVIEIWGIWCHDSRNDAPYAAALSRALAQDPDVDFMSIHTPQNKDRADKALRGYDSVSAWFDEKGWSFPTVLDPDASIREALRIRWTPTYLVVAPDRTVQGFRTGLKDAGDMAVKEFVQDIADTRSQWSER